MGNLENLTRELALSGDLGDLITRIRARCRYRSILGLVIVWIIIIIFTFLFLENIFLWIFSARRKRKQTRVKETLDLLMEVRLLHPQPRPGDYQKSPGPNKKMKKLLPVLLLILLAAITPTSSQAQSKPPLVDMGLVSFSELPFPITLESNLLLNSFRVIDIRTDQYIIGSLPYTGNFEDDPAYDVHAFVHKDGYIMTYLESSDNPARLFAPGPGTSILSNTGVRLGYAGTGISFCCGRHADLQHRESRGIMQVFTMSSSKNADFMIDKAARIYDRSWAVLPAGIIPYASMVLDYRTIIATSDPAFGSIGSSDADLTLGTVHRLTMQGLGQTYITLIHSGSNSLITFLSSRSSSCNVMGWSFYDLPQGLTSIIHGINEPYMPYKTFLPIITR